jgi:hypothetical protein
MSSDAKKAIGLGLAALLVIAAPEVIEVLAAALAAAAI